MLLLTQWPSPWIYGPHESSTAENSFTMDNIIESRMYERGLKINLNCATTGRVVVVKIVSLDSSK